MSLAGKWYNELKSEVNITVGADGVLSGTYKTAVADGAPPPETKLTGFADAAAAAGKPVSFGFVVAWGHPANEVGSTTVWTGTLRQIDNGNGSEEVLLTRWLLNVETDEDWNSTLIGEDEFRRTPPTDAVFKRALSLRMAKISVGGGRMPQVTGGPPQE